MNQEQENSFKKLKETVKAAFQEVAAAEGRTLTDEQADKKASNYIAEFCEIVGVSPEDTQYLIDKKIASGPNKIDNPKPN